MVGDDVGDFPRVAAGRTHDMVVVAVLHSVPPCVHAALTPIVPPQLKIKPLSLSFRPISLYPHIVPVI